MLSLGPRIMFIFCNHLRPLGTYNNGVKHACSGSPSRCGCHLTISIPGVHSHPVFSSIILSQAQLIGGPQMRPFNLIHCPTGPKQSMALSWKISELGKGKICGMPKYCDKLNFTWQIQDLVWASCLSGTEVLRREDVTSREETLWLLRHFAFNHCWPCWVWRLLKPECRTSGQTQLSWEKHP